MEGGLRLGFAVELSLKVRDIIRRCQVLESASFPAEPEGEIPILCVSCRANRNFAMVPISEESARK